MRWTGSAGRAALVGVVLFGMPGCSEDPAAAPRVSGEVVVSAGGFTPPAITVTERDNVVWRWNSGGVQHNVTFENGSASLTQSVGEYSRQFLSTGTHRYRCTIHSSDFTAGMVGTVEVRPKPATEYPTR